YKWAGVKRGARLGRADVVCTFTQVTGGPRRFSAKAFCSGEFYLPAGGVLLEGFVPLSNGPSNFPIPVVGGTGGYANARLRAHQGHRRRELQQADRRVTPASVGSEDQ